MLPHLNIFNIPWEKKKKRFYEELIHVLCHLCTKYYVIFWNYRKEEGIFSNCWLLKPPKESMFLWVQLILFVV